MTKRSTKTGEHARNVALGTETTGTRLSLTNASAPFTSGRTVVGSLYKFSLDPTSGGVAWIEADGTAALPASDAAQTAGFWLMPGETEIVEASSALYSAILTAGTGTLYITRLTL